MPAARSGAMVRSDTRVAASSVRAHDQMSNALSCLVVELTPTAAPLAAMVCLWAAAAALTPLMQRGNEAARNLHIAFNAINVFLFLSQVGGPCLGHGSLLRSLVVVGFGGGVGAAFADAV